MNNLYYSFTCLDGQFDLYIKFDNHDLFYEIKSTISCFENKQKVCSSNLFVEQFLKAHVDRWQNEYFATDSSIEDATHFKLIYNDKTIVGEESYEPYFYNELIRSFMILEPKCSYFLIGA